MLKTRKVVPEILDSLSNDDPKAIRSRKDLSRINYLMGNEAWIRRQLKRLHTKFHHITEWGAGNGSLLFKLIQEHPQARILGIDLSPKPFDFKGDWIQNDLLNQPTQLSGGVLIANLFLHHFNNETLTLLGQRCQYYDVLIFNEPLRARRPHFLGSLLTPFIHPVTKHDMHISIDAGFQEGELAHVLDLDSSQWKIQEQTTWQGSLRLVATKNQDA